MVELGEGGLERWIVYPIVLWPVAFGSYLIATPETPSPQADTPPVQDWRRRQAPRDAGWR
jgi:hypothetical protein